MKLIIDILEEVYKTICDKYDTFPKEMKEWGLEAIKNGIPIPDNATNGDVIKMMFMPNQITRTGDDTVHMEYDFTPEWWNAPYQKGGNE